jgi:hypothetical protein
LRGAPWLRVSYNLLLKVSNAGLALLSLLLLRSVAPIDTAASLMLAFALVTIFTQLIAVPLGQDLIRNLAGRDGVTGTSRYLRATLWRATVAVFLVALFGQFGAEYLFPRRTDLGTFVTLLSSSIIPGSVSLLLGHARVLQKDMLGFVIGQGLPVNLIICVLLAGFWLGLFPIEFSPHLYIGALISSNTVVGVGLYLQHRTNIRRSDATRQKRSTAAIHAINSRTLAAATSLNTLLQHAPAPIIGMFSDAEFVVQVVLVQRFSAQFALISNAINIQFIPGVMRAFADPSPKNSAIEILAQYKKINLSFGMPAIMGYAFACAGFLYLVTTPGFWPTSLLIVLCLFIPNGLAALCGISGPVLLAAKRESLLILAFGTSLMIIGTAFLARSWLNEIGIVFAIGLAQLAPVMIQYSYIRQRLGLDIILGGRR